MNSRLSLWRVIRLPVIALCVAYLGSALLAPAMVSRLLYYPSMGSFRAPEGMRKLPGPNGTEIAVLHLPNPQAQFTIWFFHGNAEDLGDIEPHLRTLRDNGFAVFAADYPGYGHSTGRPSEKSLCASARVARDYLRKELKVPAARTILFGRSLGGGPAVQMATEERVGGLVLQSAFTSVFRVMTRWSVLPFDQFRNERKMAQINSPVLVMHGRADEVISFHHGESLFAAAPEPKQSLWVAGAMHNDFLGVAGRSYWDALRDFSALCARANASASNP
jgi:fermentation-respiration switch protein FrsA (DUF1100 family)